MVIEGGGDENEWRVLRQNWQKEDKNKRKNVRTMGKGGSSLFLRKEYDKS